jgi:hypothetical protein
VTSNIPTINHNMPQNRKEEVQTSAKRAHGSLFRKRRRLVSVELLTLLAAVPHVLYACRQAAEQLLQDHLGFSARLFQSAINTVASMHHAEMVLAAVLCCMHAGKRRSSCCRITPISSGCWCKILNDLLPSRARCMRAGKPRSSCCRTTSAPAVGLTH